MINVKCNVCGRTAQIENFGDNPPSVISRTCSRCNFIMLYTTIGNGQSDGISKTLTVQNISEEIEDGIHEWYGEGRMGFDSESDQQKLKFYEECLGEARANHGEGSIVKK